MRLPVPTRLHLFGILVLSCLAATLYAYAGPNTHTITRTNAGFSPEKLTIQKGDSVVFVNASTEDSWPASDSHPSHGRYPGLDPEYPLPPDASWKFTFVRAGVWSIHDHLHPDVHGTIIVLGDEGESIRECLLSSNDTIQAYCWEGEMSRILETRGLVGVFDAFEKWHRDDPIFKRNCHDVAHYVGMQAYEHFTVSATVTDRIETTYCNFGFYHGFMEAALRESGASGIAETTQYCERMRESTNLGTESSKYNAVGACYHGIGHAIFDSLDDTYWGDDIAMARSALTSCERAISGPWERTRCASGVFNSLAIALGSGEYDLAFSTDSLLRICGSFPGYWTECAVEVGVGYIRHVTLPLEDGFTMLRSIPHQVARLEAMQALSNDEVRRRVGEPEFARLKSVCDALNILDEWRACMRGVVTGFLHRESSVVFVEHSLAFCDQFDEDQRKNCYRIVLSYTNAFDPAQIPAVCERTDITAPECANR